MQKNTILKNWGELTKLGYFKKLTDGRLELLDKNIEIIDFHTHLGWTFLLSPPIDLNKKTKKTIHNFTLNYQVNLDIYSGQNFFEEDSKWALKDYTKCSLLPFCYGKHLTHTMPNIINEMDALNIIKSVSLPIDLVNFSNNSERASRALKNNKRLVFFCSIHPKDKNAVSKIKKFLKCGVKGIKIHPEVQLISANSKEMILFLIKWKKLAKLPVIFHSGFNGFEPKIARQHSDIKLYYAAAETLENIPCILGHSAMNQYKEATKIAKKYPNVYLELSGQPPHHIEEIITEIGSERLLFGTDWPVYPQALSLAKVLLATENNLQHRKNILFLNAEKLI